MQISTIIVAEGSCPDISLTLSSAADVSAEVILVDIGLDPSIRTQIETNSPNIKIFALPKPEFVELIRQETLAYASHEWVLLLDPDEYLSPELVKLVKETTIEEVKAINYVVTPGRYVGLPDDEEDFNFAERFSALKKELQKQIGEEYALNKRIANNLSKINANEYQNS